MIIIYILGVMSVAIGLIFLYCLPRKDDVDTNPYR